MGKGSRVSAARTASVPAVGKARGDEAALLLSEHIVPDIVNELRAALDQQPPLLRVQLEAAYAAAVQPLVQGSLRLKDGEAAAQIALLQDALLRTSPDPVGSGRPLQAHRLVILARRLLRARWHLTAHRAGLGDLAVEASRKGLSIQLDHDSSMRVSWKSSAPFDAHVLAHVAASGAAERGWEGDLVDALGRHASRHLTLADLLPSAPSLIRDQVIAADEALLAHAGASIGDLFSVLSVLGDSTGRSAVATAVVASRSPFDYVLETLRLAGETVEQADRLAAATAILTARVGGDWSALLEDDPRFGTTSRWRSPLVPLPEDCFEVNQEARFVTGAMKPAVLWDRDRSTRNDLDSACWSPVVVAYAKQRWLHSLVLDAKLPAPADLPRSVRSPLGEWLRQSQLAYESDLADLLRQRYPLVICSVQPKESERQIGVDLATGDLGDIDVLVVDSSRRCLWIVDAKADVEDPAAAGTARTLEKYFEKEVVARDKHGQPVVDGNGRPVTRAAHYTARVQARAARVRASLVDVADRLQLEGAPEGWTVRSALISRRPGLAQQVLLDSDIVITDSDSVSKAGLPTA